MWEALAFQSLENMRPGLGYNLMRAWHSTKDISDLEFDGFDGVYKGLYTLRHGGQDATARDLFWKGNTSFLMHEQLVVMQEVFNIATADQKAALDRFVVKALIESPVPAFKDGNRIVAPVPFLRYQAVHGIGGADAHFYSRPQRWDWIISDMWPKWNRLWQYPAGIEAYIRYGDLPVGLRL